jgi:hypothetical protein
MTRAAIPTPMKVTFHDAGEFLDEIRTDRGLIDRGILRLTVRRRYGSPFVSVAVVATAAVAGVVVTLQHHVGETFAGDEKATGLSAKTQAILDQVADEAKALGLEVRAGVYE